MKNTKFTKGEWKVVNMGLCGGWFDIESERGDGCIAEIVDNKHDAHLIASAPEMYHLLESISILTEGCHGVDTNEIDKLLAKARGE